MNVRAPPGLAWAALGGATILIAALPLFVDADTGAWRFGLTLIAGIAGGSVLAALLGLFLSRAWLEVVEDELLPAGVTLVLVAGLALGSALAGNGELQILPTGGAETSQREAWFATGPVLLRLLLFIAVGAGLALALILRQTGRRPLALAGAPVLTTLFALVAIDWMVMRPPIWWTALLPIGITVNHLTAALALAFLFNLAQRERADDKAFASLATALFSLALVDLWIGYAQYLIAWYGNLPEAAAFYQARTAAAPRLLEVAAGLHAAGALLLLLRRTRAVMLVSAILLLAAFLGHATWLAGDQAPAGPGAALLVAILMALWLAWLWTLSRWVDARRGGSP